ncbi:calcium uptake protein 3, mitochondrial isoform X1 [Bactrocera tryoni]|uniref:calcium uptake protein 3, mitochondrial isoform X1 n=1 Tax=Bactrocera tryoni TaxID=59916 RepID=UPI001A979010|nr:calcium uptake protein 3, mitochondrial isoform X1 [Bactrocera tryoni]
MAAFGRIANRVLNLTPNLRPLQRNLHKLNSAKSVPKNYTKYLVLVGGGLTALICTNYLKSERLDAAFRMRKSEDENLLKKLTSRERRFIKFASVEYRGQLYMTPQDFLDSVVEQEPRPRLKRRMLSDQDLQTIKDNTPPLKKGSKMLFRTLRDRGIVSYTEYLFLLSVLTKPISGFRIAFNMFDTDGNQRVEKDEFLVILRILGGTFKQSKVDEETRKLLLSLLWTQETADEIFFKATKKADESNDMESIFSGVWKDKRRSKDDSDKKQSKNEPVKRAQDDYIADDEGLQRKHRIDTTLQIHLFGKKGNQDLNYDGFYKFMDNLQTEVLELEFNEFSKGNVAITENDFAKILLRYTYLNTEEYDAYLERLMDRVKEERGITFDEFRDFCRFLNNLEDFAIAMRMYTLADRAISQSEFSRAVKICTGFSLSKHLIDTVFAIFDDNGDGMLSYREFIAIMKDRVHRGFKVSHWKVLEYDLANDEFIEADKPLFAVWRQRACRRLEHFKDAELFA